MDSRQVGIAGLVLILAAGVTGCGERSETARNGAPVQTRFPGQVTAGGGTSGEVLAQAGRVAEGSYAGGTPGIAGGAGGNTGGPATGGTVRESGRGPAGSISATPGSTTGQR
jgi:hypothetical protein